MVFCSLERVDSSETLVSQSATRRVKFDKSELEFESKLGSTKRQILKCNFR